MMNKKQLVDRLMVRHHKFGEPRRRMEDIVNSVMTEIIAEVTKGGEVRLVGFGTFKTKVRKAREGRSPASGEKIQIPEKTVAVFKPGHRFKSRLERPRVMSPS